MSVSDSGAVAHPGFWKTIGPPMHTGRSDQNAKHFEPSPYLISMVRPSFGAESIDIHLVFISNLIVIFFQFLTEYRTSIAVHVFRVRVTP